MNLGEITGPKHPGFLVFRSQNERSESTEEICRDSSSELSDLMKNRWKVDSSIILKSCLVKLERISRSSEAVSGLQRKAMCLSKSESATLSRRKVIGTEFTRRSRFTKHNFNMSRTPETSSEQKIFSHLEQMLCRAFNVEQIPGFSQIAKFLNPAGFLFWKSLHFGTL